MREKRFTLTRSQREDLWRRYKQTSDRRVAERLHAILLLEEGRSAHAVSAILHLHPKTLKRWVRIFASAGVEALCSFNYVGNTSWLTDAQIHQFTTWFAERGGWRGEQAGRSFWGSGFYGRVKPRK
jgi:transposase